MLASRLPPHEYIRFKLASLSFIKFATAASGRFFFFVFLLVIRIGMGWMENEFDAAQFTGGK